MKLGFEQDIGPLPQLPPIVDLSAAFSYLPVDGWKTVINLSIQLRAMFYIHRLLRSTY
jgi:hypothetical protein